MLQQWMITIGILVSYIIALIIFAAFPASAASVAALAALAIVFVWKFLPETKGLPVEEIVKLFEQNPSPGIASAATAAGRR